jgi:hypothetical protein
MASGNNPSISSIAVELIGTVRDIYKYLEPSHFKGTLVICISLKGEQILSENAEAIQYNKNILITNMANNMLLQSIGNDLFMWKNIDVSSILKTNDVLFYYYHDGTEYFMINNTKIEIEPMPGYFSVYSYYFFELNESLARYSINKISNSSCGHFKRVWADSKQIYFKNKPEEDMQISLKEHLSSALRGVEVTREFTLDARKPVDIRVRWNYANRNALIEIKWLGISLDKENNRISTEYSNGRAVEGAKQLKEYLDLVARDLPNVITKGYLVVIDGRRKNVSGHLSEQISQDDGYHYQSKELTFSDGADYHNTISNFEKSIRMFARPICQ